jgi:FixJ family two-component response regulator
MAVSPFAITYFTSVMDRRIWRPYHEIWSLVVQLNNSPLISIVDDDESVREAMSDMVESLGYTVAAFASGSDFLGSDRLQDSVCLITDVRMPDMGGFELHGRLIAAGYSIPTIFLTAFLDAEDQDRADKAGVLAYLQKPCDRDDLRAHIDSALGRGT